MITLPLSLRSWGKSDFDNVFKTEVQMLDPTLLPLQQGLSQSSYVSDSGFSALILNKSQTDTEIEIKAGIQYAGIIAGSCCSDDPTPVDEQPEYCELLFSINKSTAETQVLLVND